MTADREPYKSQIARSSAGPRFGDADWPPIPEADLTAKPIKEVSASKRTLIGSEGVIPMPGKPHVWRAERESGFSVVRSASPRFKRAAAKLNPCPAGVPARRAKFMGW